MTSARLFDIQVGTLLLIAVGGMAIYEIAVSGVAYSTLFVATLVLARAFGQQVATTFLAFGGAGTMIVLALWTGGANSHYVVMLPLCVFVLWTWVGRRVALLSVVAMVAVAGLLMGFGLDNRIVPLEQALPIHLAAVLATAVCVRSVVCDLRLAVALSVERAEDAERAAERAEEADQARDRFLAILSRELRTPLDSILGYTGLILEEEQNSHRIEDLRKIETAGVQLLALVNDLLDMSRVQANELDVLEDVVLIRPLVNDVVHMVTPLLDTRGNRVEVDVDEGIAVVGDMTRTRQVLLNLLVNAGKFTENGQIRVDVKRVKKRVRIDVIDNGVGIREDRLTDIFLPFVQLSNDASSGSVGLGLALCQRLAERMGGTIEVGSRPGEGSTFSLWLRAADGPVAPGESRASLS